MRSGSLQRLLEAARALPGDRDPVECFVPSLHAVDPAPDPQDLRELRAQVGALVRELADRTEPALHQALARAASAWDQADALVILDDALLGRNVELQTRWRQAAHGGPAERAAAVEALLALDAAFGLVALVERRLATLIRLRGDGDLLPEGRPFLDVSSALHDVARGWA